MKKYHRKRINKLDSENKYINMYNNFFFVLKPFCLLNYTDNVKYAKVSQKCHNQPNKL